MLAALTPVFAADQAESEVSFNKHIRPLLTQHCTACHGGVKQLADLSFVYPNDLASVVEAGAPDDSLLIDRVAEPDDEFRMPPADHGRRLNPTEVELLRRWIDQGAKWQRHWAYEPPTRHPQPEVSDKTWPRQPLDAFVLADLESREIQPSSDEDPRRWLRRVSFALIGLPPTPDELEAFVANVDEQGETAYELAVDRLLASPRFGENWARVWFDLVRYADSRGMGIDGMRQIWHYRDYVIRSFNQDLPYNEFTVQQMAGDLLPDATIEDRLATAMHRLTQSNEEGGTDDEEFRIAALVDRVNTTWQTWLGTSFGCTQCHDHPYDPFEHKDYYRFMAFFNNSADSDLNDDWPLLSVPRDDSQYEAATKLDRQIRKLQHEIWYRESQLAVAPTSWHPLKRITAKSPQVPMLVTELADREEFHTNGTVPVGLTIELTAALESAPQQITAIRLTARPLDPQKAEADSEWGFVLSNFKATLLEPDTDEPQELKIVRVLGDEPYPRFDPDESLNSKSNSGFAAYSRIHFPRQALFVLAEPVALEPGSKLSVTLHQAMNSGGSHPLAAKRGDLAITGDSASIEMLADDRLAELNRQLKQAKLELSKIKSSTVPVMQERPDNFRRPTHVFERGLFLTKGVQVSPGVPDSLAGGSSIDDRLQLAQWMVASENPLVARVAVNRFWARLFGTGLVLTEEDFGSTGEAPSHPALLDDLAVRFQEDYAWHPKKLIREIVLSRTYRQSAKKRPELQESDPANRLLAIGPRIPLSAEMVRDQALAISGLLDTTMYGPPVRPPISEGVWQPFDGGDKWPATERGDPQRYRRSIYTYVKRSIPYPMFATFDAPSGEFCVSRRLRSNTALQPLVTFNNETFVECEEVFAEKLAASELPLAQQIQLGFETAIARPATESELATLLALHKRVTARTDAAAATTAVVAAIFNLDEFLNY